MVVNPTGAPEQAMRSPRHPGVRHFNGKAEAGKDRRMLSTSFGFLPATCQALRQVEHA
jgi:hypothetical protein